MFERFRRGFVCPLSTPHPMITALLFAGIGLCLVCLVTSDCRAHLDNTHAKDSPEDRPRRD